MKVFGYLRVSTQEQGDSGAGLEAQRAAISAEASRRGWSVEWATETASASSMRRPVLTSLLDRLAAGEAQALVTSKTDRLSRSLVDFANIMATAQRQGWVLLALDSAADWSTPQGEAMASIQAVFAQLERRLISQRTKEALAAKRAAGVQLGRPRSIGDDAAALARDLKVQGSTLAGIGAGLLAAGHVPPNGSTWHPSTVHRLLKRAA